MNNFVAFSGIRGKQYFLTISFIIFTIVLVWAWERNPLSATPLPLSQQEFRVRSKENDSQSFPIKKKSLVPNSNATSVLPIKEKSLVPNSNATSVLPIKEKSLVPNSNATSVTMTDLRNDQAEQVPGIFIGNPAIKKECNFAEGKWVPDKKRPFYSGFQCKQWLSPMWACRLMRRKDFSYEGFKWVPDNCNMPDFNRETFLKRMKDKTIAFVGDSLGRQQFQSLMCMATGGRRLKSNVHDVTKEYGLVRPPPAIRDDGYAYRFRKTNTTILFYWSVSLCRLEALNSSNPKNGYFAMHLDQPVAFLKHYLHMFDVLVLNTGHHWNRGKVNLNRWILYAMGSAVKDGNLSNISNARNFAVYNIVKWVNSQLPQHPRLKVFFRTKSPRHFVNGDWNTGGSCDSTTPLTSGYQVIPQNGSLDEPVETAVRGTEVKLLDVTAFSKLRDEGHISKFRPKVATHDCLHWCLPGIPDVWNEVLFAQI